MLIKAGLNIVPYCQQHCSGLLSDSSQTILFNSVHNRSTLLAAKHCSIYTVILQAFFRGKQAGNYGVLHCSQYVNVWSLRIMGVAEFRRFRTGLSRVETLPYFVFERACMVINISKTSEGTVCLDESSS